MCIHTYIRTHSNTLIHMHTHAYTLTHTLSYTPICTFKHTHTLIHAHMHIHTCKLTHTHIHIHTCTRILIHTLIHAHIHSHTYTHMFMQMFRKNLSMYRLIKLVSDFLKKKKEDYQAIAKRPGGRVETTNNPLGHRNV